MWRGTQVMQKKKKMLFPFAVLNPGGKTPLGGIRGRGTDLLQANLALLGV